MQTRCGAGCARDDETHWKAWGPEEAWIAMNNLKRFTVCKLADHRWVMVACPPSADGEATGFFLRCQRCGKEDHEAGTNARGGGGVL